MKKKSIIILVAVLILALCSVAGIAYANGDFADLDTEKAKPARTAITEDESDTDAAAATQSGVKTGNAKTAVQNDAGSSSDSTATNKITICNYQDCNNTAAHYHNGVQYYGHHSGDGHGYHQLCNAGNCSLTYEHYHNGGIYSGHHNEDGHSHHQSGNQTNGDQSHGNHGNSGHH